MNKTIVILRNLSGDEKVRQEAYYREKRLHDEATAPVEVHTCTVFSTGIFLSFFCYMSLPIHDLYGIIIINYYA